MSSENDSCAKTTVTWANIYQLTELNATYNASLSVPDDDDPNLYDPNCTSENPVTVTFEDISASEYRIRSGIIKTPCEVSLMSETFSMKLYMKKEFQQLTGSFKERGARNALMTLTKEQKSNGVVAASAGNHALALAYQGFLLNIPVIVVMPLTAPLMKINNCIRYKAIVLVQGHDLGESRKIALKIANLTGRRYVNGYDDPKILAGQGTVGLQIIEQVPDVDAIIVPVGGGGLIAGLAVAVKNMNPNVEIIGVESERCPSFSAAIQAGIPVQVEAKSSLADGLGVPKVGYNALQTAKDLVDRVITVSEEHIALAILRLIEEEKAVVEGAGAIGLSALLANELSDLKNKKVVICLCGGNIDTTVLGRCIERGLAFDGRLVRFLVVVSDRPGGIAELTALLCELRVSIKDIFHERAWLTTSVFNVQVKCVCETRDEHHANELHKALKSRYEKVIWGLSVN